MTDTMTRHARKFADKVVRTYAVAALAAAGVFGAADALAALAELDDDEAMRRARRAVAEAVSEVLAAPPDPVHDRALLAVIAAGEAVAIAGGPIDERRLAELEVALAVSAQAARGRDDVEG